MDVTLNPLTRQISALYTARFAEPEEKKSEVVVPSSSDQVTISVVKRIPLSSDTKISPSIFPIAPPIRDISSG